MHSLFANPRLAKSTIEGIQVYSSRSTRSSRGVAIDARPPGTTQYNPNTQAGLVVQKSVHHRKTANSIPAPIIKTSCMRDGRRRSRLCLCRRGHRNANANDRLATMTSSSVLDVIGSESANDNETDLDIRSTDAPLERISTTRHLERLRSRSRSSGQMVRLKHRSRMRGCLVALSRRQNRSDGPLALLWVLSETSEDGAREKKRGSRNIGICVLLISTTYKFNDAISLPRSNVLWHGSGPSMGFSIGWHAFRLANSTTYARMLGLFQPFPKTVQDPGIVLEQAAPGKLLYDISYLRASPVVGFPGR